MKQSIFWIYIEKYRLGLKAMEYIYFLVGWESKSQESFYISVVSYNLKFYPEILDKFINEFA